MASSRLSLTPAPDRRNHASREALLIRVRGEFTEMPCLRLTRGQAQRLFDLWRDHPTAFQQRAMVAPKAS